jgi:hypothetical protein
VLYLLRILTQKINYFNNLDEYVIDLVCRKLKNSDNDWKSAIVEK